MKNLIKALSLAISIIYTSVAFPASQSSSQMMFVDLLPVHEGVSAERVEEYFNRISPIVARHGLNRVGSFKVASKMSGESNPNYINLWLVSSKNTFKDIFNDADYLKHVNFRNTIFVMDEAEMFMLMPTFDAVGFEAVKR